MAKCIGRAVKPHNLFVPILILYFLLEQGHDVLIQELWMHRLVVVDRLSS